MAMTIDLSRITSLPLLYISWNICSEVESWTQSIVQLGFILSLREVYSGCRSFGQMSSKDTEKRGKALLERFSDADTLEATLASAAVVIDTVSGGNLDRDNIHTQTFTDLIKHLKQV